MDQLASNEILDSTATACSMAYKNGAELFKVKTNQYLQWVELEVVSDELKDMWQSRGLSVNSLALCRKLGLNGVSVLKLKGKVTTDPNFLWAVHYIYCSSDRPRTCPDSWKVLPFSDTITK